MIETLQYGWGISVMHLDSMNSIVINEGLSVKPFRGETAWSDAERFAFDLVTSRKYS